MQCKVFGVLEDKAKYFCYHSSIFEYFGSKSNRFINMDNITSHTYIFRDFTHLDFESLALYRLIHELLFVCVH